MAVKKAKSVTMDKDICELVEVFAIVENRNFSNMLEHMAREYIKRRNNKQSLAN